MTTVGYGDMTYDVLNSVNDLVHIFSFGLVFCFPILYFSYIPFHHVACSAMLLCSSQNLFEFYLFFVFIKTD